MDTVRKRQRGGGMICMARRLGRLVRRGRRGRSCSGILGVW